MSVRYNNALELAGSTQNGHFGPRSSTQCSTGQVGTR